MMMIFIVLLLVLWGLGMISSYTLGGFLHILLVVALIALVLDLLRRRRAV